MFVLEENRLVVCENAAGEILIPDGVTTIGSRAFADCKSLCSVVFPSSVRTIGDSAFEGCTSLSSLVLLSGVKRLGNGSLRGCTALRSLLLPDSVASLHPCAFENCISLSEIHMPQGLRRNIERHTFAGCTALERIVIPAGIQQIKSGAFSGCTALKQVTFENPGVQIDPGAFNGCTALDEQTADFIQSHTMDRSAADIKSRAAGLLGRLSNFTPRQFVFDGVACGSIEGVLQSFKCPDPERQKEICALSGGWAKHAGREHNWMDKQLLYWQGEAFPRRSDAYQQLLDRLYLAVYDQDEAFRSDLEVLRERKLDHRMGLSNPSETVLTRHEFVFRLQRLSKGEA